MQAPNSHAAIGVFDSGLGGLSVLRHVREQLPYEALIYFADTAYAPYGDRSEAQVCERSLMVTEFLLRQNIKALVVACNTATAAAIHFIREKFPELIVIGVEPGLKPAVSQTHNKRIAVFATSMTVASEKFLKLKQRLELEFGVEYVPIACKGLVNEIERAELNSPHLDSLLRCYLGDCIDAGCDTLVLGCTHYPLIDHRIRSVFADLSTNKNSPALTLVDTGSAIARRLESLLSGAGLLNSDRFQLGGMTACSTGDINAFALLAEKLSGLHFSRLIEPQFSIERGV